jgi:tryptophan-rich sensory protein
MDREVIFLNIKRLWAKLTRNFRASLGGCPAPALVVGAGVCMLLGASVRGVCGSPYQNGMMLPFGHLLPPVWLMTLLWMLSYALLGAAFARVMCDRRCDVPTEMVKYRGGMTYLAMLLLGFLWYPVFFCAGRVFVAALIVLGVLVLCLVTALRYLRAFFGVSLVLFAHAIFLAWLFLVNLGAALGV